MSATITSLKFWGQKQDLYNGRFRFSFPELRLSIVIHEATEATRCYWTVTESGSIQASSPASGVKAARNAAQRWLERRAEMTRDLAAKGRAA